MSVEKKGLPVPQPKMTTRPFSRCRMALAADVGLGDLVHGDGRLHPDLHAALLEAVSHGQRVDDGRQHAHMVRARALHLAAAVFDAAPEVAAADHDADLHAGLDALLDHVAHAADDRRNPAPGARRPPAPLR